MYLCGSSDIPPLAEPENQPYHLASAFAAFGVLLALRHRDQTGRGQRVEVSCQEVQAAQQHVMVNYSANANVLKRAGSRTPVGGGHALWCLPHHRRLLPPGRNLDIPLAQLCSVDGGP